MSVVCVVAAEGARARFFTLEHSEVPELEGGPDLIEHESLANPRHRAHHEKIYSDARGGRNQGPAGQSFGYDEHRDGFQEELEGRFARDIAEQLGRISERDGPRRVILCAEKRMLGFLRSALNGGVGNGVRITEVPKDLTKLPAQALHARLADEGLMPARRSGSGGSGA